MDVQQTTKGLLRRHIRDGDVGKARQLLESNPNLITWLGINTWVGEAASTTSLNALKMCKMLSRLGIPQWVQVEGTFRSAVTEAAASGQLDVLRWLVKQPDACLNKDRSLISALNRTTDDRLEVIQVLVEAGEDPNRVFQYQDLDMYFTVLDWAIEREYQSVVDYLRSVGAKTAEELRGTPAHPLYGSTASVEDVDNVELLEPEKVKANPEDVRRKLQQVAMYFQALGDLQPGAIGEVVPTGLPPITIHEARPKKSGEPLTLFTNGMSAQPMATDNDTAQYAFAELYLQMPGDWKIDLADPGHAWPVQWLRKLAAYPHASQTNLGRVYTIVSNDEPPEPLAEGIAFTSWLCFADMNFQHSDGQVTHFYRMIPLHTEERTLELTQGIHALVERLEHQGGFEVVNLNRPSCC